MSRKLTVEAFDCEYRREPKSLIRLKGGWLKTAGFPPGARVQVDHSEPGVLVIRAVQPQPTP